jgi:hypothetical protein
MYDHAARAASSFGDVPDAEHTGNIEDSAGLYHRIDADCSHTVLLSTSFLSSLGLRPTGQSARSEGSRAMPRLRCAEAGGCVDQVDEVGGLSALSIAQTERSDADLKPIS